MASKCPPQIPVALPVQAETTVHYKPPRKELEIINVQGRNCIKMYFKDQFELRSTAGLVARNVLFKSIKDVREAVIVKQRDPTSGFYDIPVFNYFTDDKEFTQEIGLFELQGCDRTTRCLYRFLTLNNSLPVAYFRLMNNYSNPATIAILTTILHVKDEVTVQSTEPSDWGKFFSNFGWSVGFVLGLILFLQLIFDLGYFLYRIIFRHIEVLRITRFQFLQDQYDEVNIYGNNWMWKYNYKAMDPDLAMIYYNFHLEKCESEKNIIGCGARKRLEKVSLKIKDGLETVKGGLNNIQDLVSRKKRRTSQI